MPLYRSRAPALPLPTNEYDRSQQDQVTNSLRLYFNLLDDALLNLSANDGGRALMFPYGSFSSAVDQENTADNTPQIIATEITDVANSMRYVEDEGIHVDRTGVYNIQFSIQFANTDSQAHNTWVWLKKNGANIASTASKYDAPSSHGSSDGYLIATCNFFLELAAEDYIALWWATAQAKVDATDGVYIEKYDASASPFSVPAVPSVVLTLSFVSAVLP